MMCHYNKAANTDRPDDVGATSHLTTAKTSSAADRHNLRESQHSNGIPT